MKQSCVALIPARSGSKRIINKNICLLDNHPLLAYSIQAAIDSQIFEDIFCITDSKEYAEIAKYYGAEIPFIRPKEISTDTSPDIDWVKWTLLKLQEEDKSYENYCILRPTSPFRRADTIIRAMKIFSEDLHTDSLRAIEKCLQHPGKMWVSKGNRITPLMPFDLNGTPWHSNQYASLPIIYVQNASLEISRCNIALEKNSISGETILPFFTKGMEGFDINEIEQLYLANYYINEGKAKLPVINKPPIIINF